MFGARLDGPHVSVRTGIVCARLPSSPQSLQEGLLGQLQKRRFGHMQLTTRNAKQELGLHDLGRLSAWTAVLPKNLFPWGHHWRTLVRPREHVLIQTYVALYCFSDSMRLRQRWEGGPLLQWFCPALLPIKLPTMEAFPKVAGVLENIWVLSWTSLVPYRLVVWCLWAMLCRMLC